MPRAAPELRPELSQSFSAGHTHVPLPGPRSKTDLLTLEHGTATGPVNRAPFQSAGPRAGIFKLEDCTASVGSSQTNFNFVFVFRTMPCNEDEESMNASDPEPPCTPPKSTGNGGAGRVEPDGQMESDDDDSDAQQVAKPKRKWNGKMEWTLMKRWVTGEKADMDQEDIERELYELAREWMAVSKLRKIPGHVAKETDVALWKQFREYPKHKGSILVRLFRCPLRHRCGCLAGIRIMEGADWMQLDRCGEHNANSHDEDKSKYLKHDQIVAVTDAVTIAQQQSAAQLRRNMQLAGPDSLGKNIAPQLLRCMQRVVRLSRAQLTIRQLQGFDIDSSFGSLTKFAEAKWFRTLLDRNNDPEDDFHFDLFSPIVIGRDINATRDIVHINLTSIWFLLNIFRVIASGWVFQLNGDATFSFCRVAVDMIGLGVNSVGNHNHPLCWSIIPHNTELDGR